MIALGLIFALIVALPQQNDSTESQATMQQPASGGYERHEETAIRINDLAGRIRSESDASTTVSEIAGFLAKELPPAWTSRGIRQRIAHIGIRRDSRSAILLTRRPKTSSTEPRLG
jgi:hypothetical protein